jgi:6,7-dimethyl-8-ribityllumazine synthase
MLRSALGQGPALALPKINFTQDQMAEPRRDLSRLPKTLPGGRLLIVEARFYDTIGEDLLTGAMRAIEAAGASCDVLSVPGALEIPIAMAIALDAAAARGAPYDGAVALGCVIRGETYHFEIVAGESSRALIDLGVARRLALGNGILTVENEPQAEERADPARGDKGGDAARAAITLAALKRELGVR